MSDPISNRRAVMIYTDGACEPNPGQGAYAALLVYEGRIGTVCREIGGRMPDNPTTNNRAELMAAIVALESLKTPCVVHLVSDSKWLINCAERSWQRNANTDLWTRFDEAAQKHEVRYRWVKGHNGDVLNERADRLAVNLLHGGRLHDGYFKV